MIFACLNNISVFMLLAGLLFLGMSLFLFAKRKAISNTDPKTYPIYTNMGLVCFSLGDQCIGTGSSGESDGKTITGKFIEYDKAQNSVILGDKHGMLHAVVPSTLEKC